MNTKIRKALIWITAILTLLGIAMSIYAYKIEEASLGNLVGAISLAFGAISIIMGLIPAKEKDAIDWNALTTIRQNDQELIELQRKTIEDLEKQLKRKNQPNWEKAVNRLLKKGKLQEAIDSIDTNVEYEEAAKKLIFKAQLYIANFQFPEAEAHYKQAADIFPSYNNNLIVGNFFWGLNRFKEAEDYYTRCLNQAISPKERANVLIGLGNVQNKLNDYAQAEPSFTEALKTYRVLAGKNPKAYLPYVATTFNNLGELHRHRNEHAQAEASYTEALQIRRELAGKNSQAYLPDVAMTLNNLGGLYWNNNNYAQAEASYMEALQIRRELAATNPQAYLPDVATTLVSLSMFYQDYTPNKDKSLPYAKEAIEVLNLCNDTPYVQTVRETVRLVIDDWKGKN
ncbi:hypothetical protein FACS1894181_10980 [Bacteroidia bacterium]|nr:hypothetical protein FACS1894181_10980 [Bacteroidia bacterium]